MDRTFLKCVPRPSYLGDISQKVKAYQTLYKASSSHNDKSVVIYFCRSADQGRIIKPNGFVEILPFNFVVRGLSDRGLYTPNIPETRPQT